MIGDFIAIVLGVVVGDLLGCWLWDQRAKIKQSITAFISRIKHR